MPTDLSRFQILSTPKTKPTQLGRKKQTVNQKAMNGSGPKELQEALNLSYFYA
jgi:hypothetical protein